MLSNEKGRSLFWTCTMHCCTEPWNHHHTSNRKWCQHVLMLLYRKSIDGQFPIQTATYSCSSPLHSHHTSILILLYSYLILSSLCETTSPSHPPPLSPSPTENLYILKTMMVLMTVWMVLFQISFKMLKTLKTGIKLRMCSWVFQRVIY